MEDLKFEWDENKAEINLIKHGISFEEAATIFSDELARLIPDPESSFGEERFLLLGISRNLKLLIVCHCYKDKDRMVRIISARKADKRERKAYEEFKHA